MNAQLLAIVGVLMSGASAIQQTVAKYLRWNKRLKDEAEAGYRTLIAKGQDYRNTYQPGTKRGVIETARRSLKIDRLQKICRVRQNRARTRRGTDQGRAGPASAWAGSRIGSYGPIEIADWNSDGTVKDLRVGHLYRANWAQMISDGHEAQ